MKGLLISPEFPANAYWSGKHVIKWAGRKNAFPPLGLLTFAAELPDDWDLTLLDLNVKEPSDREIRRMIQEADAVFVGAMSIQRQSLVELLDGPARGTTTPWVLGGPMASTYRDSVLKPKSPEEQILHDGLDVLVWGESEPWIAKLLEHLQRNPEHQAATPHLFIPERVAQEPAGSRKYLLDKSIFRPLAPPIPRWDLINISDYRSMMIQTTAGCRFRCDFCDIVQFNGGFARAKAKAAVIAELEAIYATGFRGPVFTVDDNFVSNPQAMEWILEGMTEFQRAHGYPFSLFTQASVDLGSDKLAYLIPLMRRAGFTAVFLGIENPDPEALRAMNKTQNVKTDPNHTILQLQQHGIEVFAGFIFGSDVDTPNTAEMIVDFVEQNGIMSAMVGTLTPMPHTPLYVELEGQGRLTGGNTAGNNVDDELEFEPKMGAPALVAGFQRILGSLFTKRALYRRIRTLLNRVDAHIFTSGKRNPGDLRAVWNSLVRQGKFWRVVPDFGYCWLLGYALYKDVRLWFSTRSEIKRLDRFWHEVSAQTGRAIQLTDDAVAYCSHLAQQGHDAVVRFDTEKQLAEITEHFGELRTAIEKRILTREQAHALYESARTYLKARRKLGWFPGWNIINCFRLLITGYHYTKVSEHVLERGEQKFPEAA